jgi:hypothetical protein
MSQDSAERFLGRMLTDASFRADADKGGLQC